jgi:outer membrane protein assembly factor BamB
MFSKKTLWLGSALACSAAASFAADWPQWRGPDRTAVSKETGLLKSWPAEGLTVVWKAEGLGGGNSTPTIAAGRVYGMAYRGDDEVVWCVDDKNGKEIWHTKIAQANYNIGRQAQDGSGGSATVDGDRIYVAGTSGDLVCLNSSDGKVRWQKSMTSEFGGRVPQWGYAESPLVDGEKVIATPGGSSATIVALNKMTGDTIWKSQVPSGNGAHYASCIAADVTGKRQYIQFLAGGVVGVNASDGKFLWQYAGPANDVANCSTAIYRDSTVFAASSYRKGAGQAKLTPNGSGFTATETWFTPNMQNHHGGMVLIGDYIYGFDDRNAGLTCLDWKTGEVKWTSTSLRKGSVAAADGMLYTRTDNREGAVTLVEATPSGYVEKGRFVPPSANRGPKWSHPVIANGKLYIRDHDTLYCYDVKASGSR